MKTCLYASRADGEHRLPIPSGNGFGVGAPDSAVRGLQIKSPAVGKATGPNEFTATAESAQRLDLREVRQETANSVKISVCPLGVRTAFQLGVGDFKFFICRGVAQHADATLIELFDRNWQKHFSTKEIFQCDRLHSANDPEFKILDKRYY